MATPEKLRIQQEKIASLFDMAKNYAAMDLSNAPAELHQQVSDLQQMACQTGLEFVEILILMRDYSGAKTLLQNVLSIRDDVSAHKRLADVYNLSGQWDLATEHYQAAQKTGDASAQLQLALAYCKKQSEQKASPASAHIVKAAIEAAPNEPLNSLTFQALLSGDFKTGLALAHHAAFTKPTDVVAQFNFAQALQSLGRMDEAKLAYLNVLEINPAHVDSHLLLGMLEPCAVDDPRLAMMEQLHGALVDAPQDRLKLGFALYKAMNDLKRYEPAFHYLQDANRLRRQQFTDYSVETDIALMQQLESLFTPDLIDNFAKAGDIDEAPIFIVGLPRSGTSLTEQILASHDQIYGAGELETLSYHIADYFFEPGGKVLAGAHRITAENLRLASARYIQPIRAIIGHDLRIVDKMPVNFLWVGFIKLMFPKAKIIITTRDPIANGFALYSSYFSSDGMQYSYDLAETAHYIVAERKLTAHWKRLFPNDVLEFNYEQLTLDQEGQTRGLLAFCDLPWEAKCLEFQKNDRPVLTLSAAQVRKGLYSGVDKKTSHYLHHLQDMVKILQQAGLVAQ